MELHPPSLRRMVMKDRGRVHMFVLRIAAEIRSEIAESMNQDENRGGSRICAWIS